MGEKTRELNNKYGTDIHGVKGIMKAGAEAKKAGYDSIEEHLKNKKAKQAALQERSETRDSGNAGSMLGNRQTLG